MQENIVYVLASGLFIFSIYNVKHASVVFQ